MIDFQHDEVELVLELCEAADIIWVKADWARWPARTAVAMETLELLPGILGTPAQMALELRAARLFSFPQYRAAIAALRDTAFRSAQIEWAAGAATWERAMEELAFAFLLRNLNGDPSAPQVLWDQNPSHLTQGTIVPGSRCTGNNPDTIYRRIPIEPAGRYVLSGRRATPEARDITISVLPSVSAQESWTQTTLRASDIDTHTDGHFTVTMDADEAQGRRNHLRLAPGATRLTLRESMIDWGKETPWVIGIERIGGPATKPDPGDDATAARLAARLPAFASHWIDIAHRTYFSIRPNLLEAPTTTPGGLATQLSSLGNFELRDDEALVIRVDRLNAAYCAFQVLDPWLFGLEYRCRLGSLNYGQAIADVDGALTMVVAAHDPGVYNWIDTAGVPKGAMQMRWQGLPAGSQPVSRTVNVMRMRLNATAALDLAPIAVAERRRQIGVRRAAHDRRFSITPGSSGDARA